jgi:hypothetical protein
VHRSRSTELRGFGQRRNEAQVSYRSMVSGYINRPFRYWEQFNGTVQGYVECDPQADVWCTIERRGMSMADRGGDNCLHQTLSTLIDSPGAQ